MRYHINYINSGYYFGNSKKILVKFWKTENDRHASRVNMQEKSGGPRTHLVLPYGIPLFLGVDTIPHEV